MLTQILIKKRQYYFHKKAAKKNPIKDPILSVFAMGNIGVEFYMNVFFLIFLIVFSLQTTRWAFQNKMILAFSLNLFNPSGKWVAQLK